MIRLPQDAWGRRVKCHNGFELDIPQHVLCLIRDAARLETHPDRIEASVRPKEGRFCAGDACGPADLTGSDRKKKKCSSAETTVVTASTVPVATSRLH